MPYEWPEWLTFDEEIKIVVERLNCRRRRAEKIVLAYWSSTLPSTVTEMQVKHFKATRKGFQEWLNRRYPPPMLERSWRSNRASKTAPADKINKVWDEYCAVTNNPSMDEFEKFARENKGLSDREELRNFYRGKAGRPGPGRPRKSARK
jgi:hypothetical protein